jgi:cyanophycin synthetase
MKILETKVMRGPNVWSNYRKKLIYVKLDIGEFENFPTDKIDGFYERLKKLLPSLYYHECSEGCEGGFFERVKRGTWIGHVIEHIALELQLLAGSQVGFGRTRSAEEPGVYNIVFSYEIEQMGLYAIEAAMRIAVALTSSEQYDLEADIKELSYLKGRYGLGPSTGSIVAEAGLRNIPYKRLNDSSLVVLGYGKKQRKIRAAICDSTSGMGIEMASDKAETKKLLSASYIPVPEGQLVYDEKELKDALEDIHFPLVVKPLDSNHGNGVTTHITTEGQALEAFAIAKKFSKEVIVEEFIEGYDYRFLVIDFKMVAVAKRTPAMVTGDGKSTISQLIEETNLEPERGDGHEKTMTKIVVDEITEHILTRKKMTLDTVLPLGEILFLKDTANLSSGGTARDVTDLVHPYNKFMVERIAKILNLNICGVDIVAKDINIPITRSIGGVVEVNACPGLRMHLSPAKGYGRNVAEPIVDMMFPNKDDGRIPVVAITGTNGKTTTTRLVAHMAKQAGFKVGYTTTEGIHIQDQVVHEGDCTGPLSAQAVLWDPTIDFAVIECARGGILRSGLGFDTCDISIVTNITDDHLGLKGVNTLEDLAKVKSVVARSTTENGYAILNADDDLVYEMRHDVDGKIALFSMDANNPRIQRHCDNDGLAAYVDNGYLVVCKGKWKTRIERIVNIPLSLNGRAECMVKNIMPATLAAIIRDFDIHDIRQALKTFIPSAEQTPGRMNIFKFSNFEVMVDYAHNPDGFMQLKKFMDNTQASVKVGIVSGTGDRRDEDIRTIGRLCAQIFDELIIKHDHDLRGRTREEITSLISQGAYSVKEIPIQVISNEEEAIHHALEHARENAFITVCADKVFETIATVKQAQIKDEEKHKQNSLVYLNHKH